MKHRAIIIFTTLFFSIVFSSCVNNDQPLYRIQQDGLYGFIDNQGKIVIAPQYKYVSDFSKEGVALVVNELNKRFEYDSLNSLSIGLLKRVCIDVNYGYINKKNQIINDNNAIKLNNTILDFWYHGDLYEATEEYNSNSLDFRSSILDQLKLSDGLYVFQDEATELLGYKDINNKVVIEPKYERCRRFQEGVAVVFAPWQQIRNEVDFKDSLAFYRMSNYCGAINTKGELVIDYDYTIVQDFMDNGTTWACALAPTGDGYSFEDWVCIDKSGSIVSGPVPNREGGFIYNNQDYPIYQINFGHLGYYYTYLDKAGDFLSDFDKDGELNLSFADGEGSPELFKDVIWFSEGVAGLYAKYRGTTGWFFIDSTMSPISIAYDSICPFSESMAAVKEMGEKYNVGKWGFVKKSPSDNSIIQAIPFSYSDCGSFHNGLAYFSKSGSGFDVEGYIDKEGEIVWQTKRNRF